VLLLDCCFGGAFERGILARSGDDVQVLDAFQAQHEEPSTRGRWVITASTATQYAFEEGELTSQDVRPSLFTGAVVDALTTGQADRDGDGWVGLNELFAHVAEDVRTRRREQTPQMWAFGSQGDMRLARSRLRRVSPTPLEPELTGALHSTLTATRLGLVPIFHERLLGEDLGSALAAFQSLNRLRTDDSKMVSDAAAEALSDIALHVTPDSVVLSSTAPAVDLHLSGPPLAVAVAARADAPWLTLEYLDDAIRVRATAQDEAGSRTAEIQLTGPVGTTTVPVSIGASAAVSDDKQPAPKRHRLRKAPLLVGVLTGVLALGVIIPLAVILPHGGEPTADNNSAQTGSVRLPTGPRLSDDVLVWASNAGREWELRTGATFGSARSLVPTGGVSQVWPAISPSRRTIAYLAATGGGTTLHVVGSDGADDRVLWHSRQCREPGRPAWRPDGSALTMVCHDGNGAQQCGVCVLSLRGTVLAMIDPRHTVATPAWSPDGKYLVYARRNGTQVDGKDGYSIFAAAPDGSGHPIRLTTDPTIDLLPTVSPVHPHGRYQVAFQRRARGKPNQIWLVTVTAGEPTRIGTPQALPANDPRHPNHDPTWSPSGDKLAFSRNGTLVQTDPMSSSSSYQRLFPSESPHSDYKAVWASR
jgi:hypothetical protein